MIEIISTILQAKKIALFAHVNPDGDTLGCICALHLALKKLNKISSMYCDGIVPEKFTHLSCKNEILNSEIKEKYDLYISLDSSSLDRIGKYASNFSSLENTIQIDHHKTNTNFAKHNFVDFSKAACCEIIYELITNLEVEIDEDIAKCIIGGIYTDTGAFCNGNTTTNSFSIASKLAYKVPNLSELTFNIFRKRTLKEYTLLKKALSDSMFSLDNKVYVLYILNSTLADLGAKEQDTNYIITASGMVDGVLINVFICESEKNVFKVGFRSHGNIDVSLIAESLGGGGHKNASGCSINGNFNLVLNTVLKECQKELARWKKTV